MQHTGKYCKFKTLKIQIIKFKLDLYKLYKHTTKIISLYGDFL